jgi:hypothetical protein
MTLTPWVFEALVALLIGLSGVGAGILVGWRQPLLLASAAILVAAFSRVVSALGLWSVGLFSWLTETWWVTSAILAVIGAIVGLRRF